MNLLGVRKLGDLYEGRELRERVGITHDAGGEEERDGARIGAECARGVAADSGVGVKQRAAVRGVVELAEAVQGPERMNGGERRAVRGGLLERR